MNIIWINFFARIIYNFRKTDIFTRSGSLSFTILLSFIPFTISMVSIASWMPIQGKLIAKIQHHIFTSFIPPDAAEQIYHQVKIFLRQAHHLSILGFVFLLITTYLMVFAIEKQLNAIWHNRQSRTLSKSIVDYTAFLICGLVLTGTVSVLQISRIVFLNSSVVKLFEQSLSVVVITLLYIMVYKVIPRHRAKFKHVLIAAITATLIFYLLKGLFMHVLTIIFDNYHVIYGSLSFLPIFLLWIYTSCLNLFFCAGIIHALETRFNRQLQHKLNKYLRYLCLME